MANGSERGISPETRGGFLSDRDIEACLQSGRIKIDPFPDLEKQLGPASLDFSLGERARIFRPHAVSAIDPEDAQILEQSSEEIEIPREGFILHPGQLIIVNTRERLILANDLLAFLGGKSSLGRLGLIIHSTAARFDPGYNGYPVLELSDINNIGIRLRPGMLICSFVFAELNSPAKFPYGTKRGRFFGQEGPTLF